MAYSTLTKRNHTRGPAIVLGMLVLLAFMAFLMMATPGKPMLEASGMSDANPLSVLGSMYNTENIFCAFEQMNCNVLP
ncbi:MAG TPA: hypothetical protein VGQ03_08665 [Nitrososphaera sp.]|jgi:hypothetical protein|nr:hypothetical protein [Nitrososphaera sp.]